MAGRQKGSITIYLLLSLTLMMAIICTMTESARVNCINAKLRGITFMAADSCFSEYVKEIFDDYGIMALWKDESEFTASFDDYLQKNLSIADLEMYQDADLYLMDLDASAIEDVEWITDDNGMVFTDQVCEYMQYFLSLEGIELILSNLKLVNEGSQIASFISKINQYQDVFVNVGTSAGKIQQNVDKAKSVVYNPKTILGNMKSSMDKYEETGQYTYVAQFNTNYWNLEEGKDQLETYMDNIQTETDNYHTYMSQAEDAIEQLQGELDNVKNEYSDDAVQAIQTQLDSLYQKTADSDADYYNVDGNMEKAAQYQAQLDTLNSLLDDLGGGPDYKTLLSYKSTVDYYDSAFDSFDLDELGLNTGTEVVKVENSGFISTVSDIFTKGLLAAVTEGDISDSKVDTSQFPSKTVKRSGGSSDGIASASYKKVMLSEYVLRHLGNYIDPKDDTALKYEAEYVLKGKSSDRENLKLVVEDLVALRSGLNMISFYKDADKLAQAEAIATGIIGFTGLAFLVELLKTLIVSIWCLAESLCDVKTIMAGGKIPLIKASYEWTITAVGLKNFSKTVVPSASDDSGLGYAEYLGMMLLSEGIPDEAYRTMDMIQANMCKNHNSEFRMSGCITSISVQVGFQARQLFSAFAFVQNIVGNQQGNYGFTYTQEYSY